MQNSWSKSPEAVEPSKSELNPLLNPLLEENLGRWAQVYFTNPPEVRERAVLDLLRELEDKASGRVEPKATITAKPAAETVICPACDAENRSQQRYCGFCGSPLRARDVVAFNAEPYAPPSSEAVEGPEPLSFLGLSSPSPSAKPAVTSGRQEGNDLQFLRMKDFGSEYYESEGGRARRWVLAGFVIALLAGAYVGWPYLRSHLPSARKNTAAVSPAPAASTATPPAIENPRPAPVVAQDQITPPADSSKAAPAPEPPAMHAAADSSLNVNQGAVPASMASRVRNAPSPSDSAARAPDGNQELVAAERYLNGKGAPRDPAAASRLLWKSVGKQNPHAALLLANLYEHGDGVSKSCAQARILLGVAADKGLAEAGKNLRTLESTCQ